MAKAVSETQTIRVDVITLTLSSEEANTLRSILMHIGGSETKSPREHADSIATALNRAGVTGGIESRLVDVYSGRVGVQFNDYRRTASPTTAKTRAWGSI